MLTLLLSLLASSTASAQDAGRDSYRTEKQTQTRSEGAPETFSVAVAAGVGDGQTVIFQAPPTAPDFGVSAGPPSCEFDCIEAAWVTANMSSTALTLNVETRVDTSIRYEVGTHAPFLGKDGLPYFQTAVTTGHTFIDTTSWTASVDGLAANTDYYLIVEATDDGGTQAEYGAFRTITPVTQSLDTWENESAAGCSLECITAAELITYPDETDRIGWAVETQVPTVSVISISEEAVNWVDGTPTFPSIDASAAEFTHATQHNGSVNGLDSATVYNVIVAVSDELGHTDHFVGHVGTGAQSFDVLYAPLRTIVHENGDAVGRAEVSFHWSIRRDGVLMHQGERGEKKMKDGESFYHSVDAQYSLWNLPETDILPKFSIYGSDADAFQFGSLGNEASLHHWYWNDFFTHQTVADLDNATAFPPCGSFDEINSDHPFANEPCVKIQTYPHSGQTGLWGEVVHFSTIVAINKWPAGESPYQN